MLFNDTMHIHKHLEVLPPVFPFHHQCAALDLDKPIQPAMTWAVSSTSFKAADFLLMQGIVGRMCLLTCI